MTLKYKERMNNKKIFIIFYKHILSKTLNYCVFISSKITHTTFVLHGDTGSIIPVKHAYQVKNHIS